MVILKLVIPVYISLFLSACATTKHDFVAAEPSLEKGSVVYLYRPRDVANVMLSPEIDVDEETITLGMGEYQQLYLEPGEYVFKLKVIEGYTEGDELVMQVKPGTVSYLQLASSLNMQTGLRYSAYKREFKLQLMSPVDAHNELARSRDVSVRLAGNEAGLVPSIEDVNTIEADETGSRFSMQKTLNPFAR